MQIINFPKCVNCRAYNKGFQPQQCCFVSSNAHIQFKPGFTAGDWENTSVLSAIYFWGWSKS